VRVERLALEFTSMAIHLMRAHTRVLEEALSLVLFPLMTYKFIMCLDRLFQDLTGSSYFAIHQGSLDAELSPPMKLWEARRNF